MYEHIVEVTVSLLALLPIAYHALIGVFDGLGIAASLCISSEREDSTLRTQCMRWTALCCSAEARSRAARRQAAAAAPQRGEHHYLVRLQQARYNERSVKADMLKE